VTGSELLEVLEEQRKQSLKLLRLAYIGRADEPDDELYAGLIHGMGIEDDIAIAWLLACWKIQRENRALGDSPTPAPKDDKATPRQLDYIKKLAGEKGYAPPDEPLTKAQAGEIIDSMMSGSYDPDKWRVPF